MSDQDWKEDPVNSGDTALHEVLDVLASEAGRPIPADVRARHLEAMLAEVRATRPAVAPAPSPWGRRLRRAFALTGVKVVLVGSVAAATTGGLAATGTLPDPVQGVVHDLGERVGVGVPAAPGQLKKLDGEDSAREFAPGQRKKVEGASDASDLAPGRQGDPAVPGDAPAGSGRDDAPGQVKKSEPGTPGRGDAPGQVDRTQSEAPVPTDDEPGDAPATEQGPPEEPPGQVDETEPAEVDGGEGGTPDGGPPDDVPAGGRDAAPGQDREPGEPASGKRR